MIRFRNPGTQYSTQIQVFKELYKEYKNAKSFDLNDMAETIAKTKLMTAYGYSGEEALALSQTENDSLNSAKMNAKMYAEVFRLLGWVTSAGKGSYPLVFTFIGDHVAAADDELPLYEQCVLGINNPQEIMKVKYEEKSRFFKVALFALEDLDGIMYKHELCIGPMSIDDSNKETYKRMIAYIKGIRGSYSKFQEAYDGLCEDLGVKPSLPDNSTRLPIAFMKTCGWIETERTNKLYPPRTLECIKLTDHGKIVADSLHEVKDLRLDEFTSYPERIQKSLIRLGMYDMLIRAGYDASPVRQTIENDTEVCKDILQGRDLLFSPYQTIRYTEVDEALGIQRSKGHHEEQSIVLTDSHRRNMQTRDLLLNVETNTSFSEDGQIKKFINCIQEYFDDGMTLTQIVNKIFDQSITETQTSFYPFVAMLFRVMGLNCTASRPGDNGARWDAIIIDDEQSIPIEIKSPTEELHISLKAIRQALENKIILLSRKSFSTLPETTSLVVGYYLPNDRAEVTNLLHDFKKTYGISIGIIDLKTMLTMAISVVIDKKTFDIAEFNTLEGFVNVITR